MDTKYTQKNSQIWLENELNTINNEIQELDNDIKNNIQFQILYSIIVWDYESIPHWDDVFNIWDINDIRIQEILQNNSNDYSSIISDTIWFNDYNNLNPEYKEILNILFSNIKSFHKENQIGWVGEVKDFLKNYQKEFTTYIQNKLKENEI